MTARRCIGVRNGRGSGCEVRELDLIPEDFAGQVVQKTMTAGELLDNMLDEPSEAAFDRSPRRFLRVVANAGRVRKPDLDPDREGFRQKL
jgi:hypothetical protein